MLTLINTLLGSTAQTKQDKSLEMRKGIHKYWLDLDFELEIEFFILSSHIYTYIHLHELNKKKEYIVIEIEVELSDYDSYGDASKSRPRYLIILSILSFITGKVFTINHSRKFSTDELKNSLSINKNSPTTFIYNGYNKSDELNKLLQTHEGLNQCERRLVYSLLDRWRKGLFLESESEANFLYNDETLLAYFHVLELLSSKFTDALWEESTELSKKFLDQLLVDTFKVKGHRKKAKLKFMEEMIRSEISTSVKICYMLDKLEMLDAHSQQVVEKLVKDRNAISHARQVHQESLTYPVLPFFSSVQNITDEIEIAKVITARSIASHLNLEMWKDEWEELLKQLPPAYETVQLFIKDKCYLSISIDDFISGKYDISPSILCYYTEQGKIKLKQLEEILQKLIGNLEINEISNVHELLWICVLLADSTDTNLGEKCKSVIEVSYRNHYVSFSELRIFVQHLEYLDPEHHKFSVKWISEWLSADP